MSAKYDTTSLTLLGRVRLQEPEAWDRLVELYAPLVRYWCQRSDLGPEDTADLFQEVFRAVSQNVEGFERDASGGTFRGWLRTITANKIRDHFRRQAGKAAAQGGTDAQMHLQAVVDPLAESDGEEDAAEQNLVHESLHKALGWIKDDFEEKTWTAFWQCQVEEQPTDVIAQSLGMTPAAVRKAKYRDLRRLREELEGLIEGEPFN